MTGTEFVAQLIAENEELLARIDAPAESRPSERSDPQSFDTLPTLMKMAPKNPDEDRHHRNGCTLLARLATTAVAQEAARRAARGLLETGDRVRTAALRQTGASVIPGC